jgi:hypothetical protein
LLVDFSVLIFKLSKQSRKAFQQEDVTRMSRPDIYLIIADEYADSLSLHQVFGFNNSHFQTALRNRGFHIVQDSRSNYNFTPFSVASLFQMNYLTGIKGHNQNLSDKTRCYELINNSPLWGFLRQEGYEVKNHSIFSLANIPTEAPQNYVLVGKNILESQTFLSRLSKDLGYHLVTTLKLKSEMHRYAYSLYRCNQLLLDRLVKEPAQVSAKPKFVYAHISMPHYPYYFRKNGKPNPIEFLQEGQQVRKKEYVDYLQFSNGLYLEAIDQILLKSKQPPIIIFMGDHGFREFTDGFEKNAPFYYMNINAVLLPESQRKEFYKGISIVNQMRALLNTQFEQRLPYLKDSSILIYE